MDVTDDRFSTNDDVTQAPCDVVLNCPKNHGEPSSSLVSTFQCVPLRAMAAEFLDSSSIERASSAGSRFSRDQLNER